jgi:pimeloyl-ACP methyl ester carboxylesterase
MRLAVWARRIALAVVAVWAVAILGWAPWWISGFATTRRFQFPDRENNGLTPKSFELPFEDVAFQASDAVPLKGWWVPAPAAKGSVVMVHGLNRSRIEMVKKAPFVVREGWNVLLFDLRHHGESGGAACTLGAKEKQDVLAAVGLARAKSAGPVVVWGISLGAASATLAAAADPTIGALVCDSSYRSLRDTVSHHLALFRGFVWWGRVVPKWPVADSVVFWMGRRGGFDPDQIDVVTAARKLNGRPALFVCNSEDRRMPKEIAFDLKDAAGARARVLVVPGTSHGGAYRDATAAYEHAVSGVLGDALNDASPQRLASHEGRSGAP